MTVLEAITQTEALRPSQYDRPTMVRWLSELDWEMWHSIIQTHDIEEYNGEEFYPYDSELDLNENLLAPDPYSRIYPLFLMAQVDFHNGEIGRYNNSLTQYNEARQVFADAVNRNFMPWGKWVKGIKGGWRE